ncbi:WD repeat-containing protein 88 [Amblyraja radiata]|uniref:WD repeat-containing protein 88 n=1 Tax=Amblyraja radiata TaxID=386614 RepID=UPI001403A750|nr:WD repeat-containing protein 88 [Amblyraja radiata]
MPLLCPQEEAPAPLPDNPLALEPPSLGDGLVVESERGRQRLTKIPYQVYLGHTSQVSCCNFCFDDTRFITSSFDESVILWDVATRSQVCDYRLHTAPVTECCLSPDNQRLFTSSWDKSLKAWDVETGKVLWAVVHHRPLTCCDISFDGRHVVCGSDINNAVYIRASDSGYPIASLQEQHGSTVTRCRFSPDGQRVASTSCDRTARIWDMLTRRTTITLQRHGNVVSDCCFTQQGNALCTSSWDRTLLIWDVSVGQFRSQGPLKLAGGHRGCVSSCTFSRDANLIVAGSYDHSVSIWDTAGLYTKLVLKDHNDWVTDVDISADNARVLSACKDSTVLLWNIERLDQIPAVQSQRKLGGENVVQCAECHKPFSICLEDSSLPTCCSFCRLSATGPDLPQLPDV